MKNETKKSKYIHEEIQERKTYTSYDQLPLHLSVKQLADVLGVCYNTAYELVRSGEIPSKQINRQYRIPKDALQTYMTV